LGELIVRPAAVESKPTAATANASPKCIGACISVSTWALAKARIAGAFLRNMPSTVPKTNPTSKMTVPYPTKTRSAVFIATTVADVGTTCHAYTSCQV
jgi:hypothetical protein